jgi:hypothetical protein
VNLKAGPDVGRDRPVSAYKIKEIASKINYQPRFFIAYFWIKFEMILIVSARITVL